MMRAAEEKKAAFRDPTIRVQLRLEV
jgi:hypothetical protein